MSQSDFWDDEDIRDDETLLRRVPMRPDFVAIPNAGTGRTEITKAALTLKAGEDGLSVNRDSLLPDGDIDRKNIYDWSDNYGVEFPVEVVRLGGDAGVVPDPVTDEPGGASHALIKRRTTNKLQWNDVRAQIIAVARWMPEGPQPGN